MKTKLPPWFQYKVVIDALVLNEGKKTVVNLVEYRKLREQQDNAYTKCKSLYFPKKSK